MTYGTSGLNENAINPYPTRVNYCDSLRGERIDCRGLYSIFLLVKMDHIISWNKTLGVYLPKSTAI